jgi:type II secretory pathway pseudopilin PulG
MRSKWNLGLVTLLAAIVSLTGLSLAQETRTETVKFKRGASSTSIEDSITGYEGVSYLLGVTAGQRMSVELDTDNTSNYFNITAPGASEALYNGSIDGNSTSFVIPSSGNYKIDVYLMRNAARRGEEATYDLTISVEGKAAASKPVSSKPVPDFADGLAGGPDYWQVHGLTRGDTLNVRASAASAAAVLGVLDEGDVIRNLGCKMNGATRWCRIEDQTGLNGWVSGKYLHESTRAPSPSRPATPPPATQPPVSSADGVPVALMPRFCAGEASAQFGERPQDITTNAAFKSGKLYVSQGWFDGSGGTTFFNCYFKADGTFIAVN